MKPSGESYLGLKGSVYRTVDRVMRLSAIQSSSIVGTVNLPLRIDAHTERLGVSSPQVQVMMQGYEELHPLRDR